MNAQPFRSLFQLRHVLQVVQFVKTGIGDDQIDEARILAPT
jgi:hypothetical protein